MQTRTSEMSDRPTPQTDAVATFRPNDDGMTDFVLADFARRLERERDEASADLLYARARSTYLESVKDAQRLELQELRAEVQRLKESVQIARAEVEGMTAKQDRTRRLWWDASVQVELLQERLDDAQTNVKSLTATVDSVRAENARLREVLQGLAQPIGRYDYTAAKLDEVVCAIAREALAGKEGA